MAKKKKGLYYTRFMQNGYDPDTLVQDYAGLLMLSVPGHVYVVKTLFGGYRLVHNDKEDIGSFGNIVDAQYAETIQEQFFAKDFEDSFFYRYLAK